MEVFCKNTGKQLDCKPATTFTELYGLSGTELKSSPVCVCANGVLMDMSDKVYEECQIEFLDATSTIGARTYSHGLVFVLAKAVKELYGGRIRVSNAISKGFYCPVYIDAEITQDHVDQIRKRMEEIISSNIPFVRHSERTASVVELMRSHGREDAARLLETSGSIYTRYYTLQDMPDWYFGVLPPSTASLKVFGLEKMHSGVLVRMPSRKDPSKLEEMVTQDKMFGIFREHHDWMEILGFSTLGELNQAVERRETNMIINVAEALQSKKIVHIADQIAERRQKDNALKVVLVSGPSSSGKTTFSKRLMVQLLAHGITPKVLSLDDYFVSRDRTPLDENGEYDFESLYAIDLELFNTQLKQLLAGETIQPPTYNFKKGGIREFTEPAMKLGENDILLVEGIHALNPDLIPDIPQNARFLIYVSALTSIRLDEHNYIPSTDNRLLRRMTRDNKYRNYKAQDTLARWASVRAGEEKWIFPYQENADAMFNSAMLFELAVIKDMVVPLLEEVPEDSNEYARARELRQFLKMFKSIPSQNLPPTSLVREFIGGSSFHY